MKLVYTFSVSKEFDTTYLVVLIHLFFIPIEQEAFIHIKLSFSYKYCIR